jgi:glycosyltransferase involved in cell wall biosynthesis
MKVLFDHQIFSLQTFGGASRYYAELFKHLPKDEWETTTLFSNNKYIDEMHLFSYHNLLPENRFRGKFYLMDLLNRSHTLRQLKSGLYDIFHQTYFGDWCFKAIPNNKKMVMTFHDMNLVRFGSMYRLNGVNDQNIVKKERASVSRADSIIAVSHYTKNDLIEYFGVDPDKITVIYHGISQIDPVPIENEALFAFPYILYVGERLLYKNFAGLVSSMELLGKYFPELHLVCTGRPFNKDDVFLLKKHHLFDKAHHISADEKMLKKLYRNAELFVYPSFSEGFGIPVLEAMQQGCPVALSNAGSFPEVAGDAAVYFNPNQVDDMAEKIKYLLDDVVLREQKVQLGFGRLKLFSWDKTAKEHQKVYNELILQI